MNQAYLDHAATTSVRPEVLEATLPFLTTNWGNPSSAHATGRAAKAGLEQARRDVAESLDVEPAQVCFTSGGTEADNLAILGSALAARARQRNMHVAISAIEHHAVLSAAEAVVELGGSRTLLPVDPDGMLDTTALDAVLAQQPALVSVLWVNNEIGVVQAIEDLAARCLDAGVPLHSDAIQGFGKVAISPIPTGCRLLSISGHKIGAPKGIGALIVRDSHLLNAIHHGGRQQGGLRPGTENLAGAVGLGVAARLARSEQQQFSQRITRMRQELEQRLRAVIPDLRVHAANAPRAPQILSISIPGTDTQSLQMHLDLAGFAVSGGSACSTGAIEPSHVLLAMGVDPSLARGTLRFSLGRDTTMAELDLLVTSLPQVVARVRNLNQALEHV